MSQRRVAQRQRRDREKQYWKDAKAREKDVMKETMGKQEKLSKQRELEVGDYTHLTHTYILMHVGTCTCM